MPWGLTRYHHTGQSHFVTFSCYHRRPLFTTETSGRVFENALERVRRSFCLRVYAYVVMPEHIHLLVSEPERNAPLKPTSGLNGPPFPSPLKPTSGLSGPPTLADALKSLKQGVARRLIGDADHFWQKRYYDFNVRDHAKFVEKLHYIHWNPVRRGLCERPEDWAWSSFLHHARGGEDELKSSRNVLHAGANEQREGFVRASNCPTQANTGLEWATASVKIEVRGCPARPGNISAMKNPPAGFREGFQLVRLVMRELRLPLESPWGP